MNASLTNRGLLRAVLLAFALFLAYRFLAGLTTILLLLAAALLLAVILSAPVEALHRRKLSRPLATGLIVLGVLGILGLAGLLLFPVLAQQASQVVSEMPRALSQLDERVRNLAQSYGLQVGSGGGSSLSSLSSYASQLLGGVLGVFGSLVWALSGLVVAVLVAVYLVAQPEAVVRWVAKFFPPGQRNRVRQVLTNVRSGLLSWLEGRLVSMAVVGALSTGALYLIGVPGALFLGILTGLLEFVPLVGPIVAAVPPLLLAFVGGPLDVLWVLLAYLAIQQIESNLLEPLVMEKAASLHPAAVLMSVTLLGTAFGILGTILAVPAAVVAAILIRELWFERLEAGNECVEEEEKEKDNDGSHS